MDASLRVFLIVSSEHLPFVFSEEATDSQKVLSQARTIMVEQYGVYECTIQIEQYEDEMLRCVHCQEPES